MLETIDQPGQLFEGVGLPELVESNVLAPTTTDTRVEGLGSASLGGTLQPFGVEQAVPAQFVDAATNTGGPTGSKGGGKFDDYKTADE